MKSTVETAKPEKEADTVFTVTANFTAEPLEDVLRFWISRLGSESVGLAFSSYNQVFQELIAPASSMASRAGGVNFLLIRIEDWARDQREGLRAETITKTAREFINALTSFAKRASRPTILLLCPPSQTVRADLELLASLRSLEEEVSRAVDGLRGVRLVTAADVAERYPVDVIDDPESDREGHIPFTPAFWVALGTMLVRKARTFLQPPHKVIAVDADNTLWRGVVAEIGAAEVHVGDEWSVLREFLRARKEQGMLLALVSKNEPADVAQVFDRSDMVLRRDDFVAWKVNWNPKSQNLRALASELNLGLDSFIFLDDNPVECAEVAAHCPSVTVLQVPSEPKDIPDFMNHVWAFDLPPATSADQGRTDQYRQQSERKQLETSVGSFREFIEKLDLRVDFIAPAPDQLERAAQLTQRTNQFNATGVRRTASELGSLLASGERQALLVRVQDRFGDYGEVGLCVYSMGECDLRVDNFLLSCRVLGKGVEDRLLAELGRLADKFGKENVVIPFRRTERNEPAAKFLESLGSTFRRGEAYCFPAKQARAIVFEPQDAGESVANEEVAAKLSATTTAGCDFANIAGSLANVAGIQSAIQKMHRRRRPALESEFVAPRNSAEQKLTEIWADVLGLDRVGVYDNLFDLGGDSVVSVQIVSRASRSGIRFSLRQQFEYPTIAELVATTAVAEERSTNSAKSNPAGGAAAYSLAKLGQKGLDQVLARLANAPK